MSELETDSSREEDNICYWKAEQTTWFIRDKMTILGYFLLVIRLIYLKIIVTIYMRHAWYTTDCLLL